MNTERLHDSVFPRPASELYSLKYYKRRAGCHNFADRLGRLIAAPRASPTVPKYRGRLPYAARARRKVRSASANRVSYRGDPLASPHFDVRLNRRPEQLVDTQ